ncbi:hypothetical protein [Sutcliffiella deserti]|uniref:hypothetical protein n=1 Tax=Sutcliffiella deserti TaxID=2875501 RepID=UPI001CBFE812|nr:hypothetical protein [Sutcliffiella deserti]
MIEYRLSSVNFHPSKLQVVSERESYCVYIKEPSCIRHTKPIYRDNRHNQPNSTLKSISVNAHETLELQFRSEKEQPIISIVIQLPGYQLSISSYIWHQHRKAYIKITNAEHYNEKLTKSLLERIYIKYRGETTFLTLSHRGISGLGAGRRIHSI